MSELNIKGESIRVKERAKEERRARKTVKGNNASLEIEIIFFFFFFYKDSSNLIEVKLYLHLHHCPENTFIQGTCQSTVSARWRIGHLYVLQSSRILQITDTTIERKTHGKTQSHLVFLGKLFWTFSCYSSFYTVSKSDSSQPD